MRGGMIYTGRDGEFRPVNPLQLLNQMLRNLGPGRSKQQLRVEGGGRGGAVREVFKGRRIGTLSAFPDFYLLAL